MKSVGEPDAGNPHVRFDERGEETGRWPHGPQVTAPLLDSTRAIIRALTPVFEGYVRDPTLGAEVVIVGPREELDPTYTVHEGYGVSTPTIAPIRQVASVPDTIDLMPNDTTSSLRSGAMVASPAIMIPSEAKLAKPHMA